MMTNAEDNQGLIKMPVFMARTESALPLHSQCQV